MNEINAIRVMDVGACRIVHGTPLGLRWARTRMDGGHYHDELQAAYRWEQGSEGGIEWRAVEIIDMPR